jgi:putative acetyltransferase
VVRIREAMDAADHRVARDLFLEYAASLGFALDFQDFESEIASLPGAYAPPVGCILIAATESGPCGCVALRPFSRDVCEMKRLYVRPAARKLGVGRALADAVIAQARERGYARMRLDTVASMVEATRLYESLRFHEIEPYRCNPVEGARFFELDLRGPEPTGQMRRS